MGGYLKYKKGEDVPKHWYKITFKKDGLNIEDFPDFKFVFMQDCTVTHANGKTFVKGVDPIESCLHLENVSDAVIEPYFTVVGNMSIERAIDLDSQGFCGCI